MSRKNHQTGPIRLGQILDETLSACGLDEQIAERALLSAWPQIAGQRLAKHVRAVDLRKGVLFLATEHSSWRQEVSLLLPRIRGECNRRYGEGTVAEIRWVQGWTDPHDGDNDNRRNG
jgi:predicted nucleic acid-binding Zn ribbon protein